MSLPIGARESSNHFKRIDGLPVIGSLEGAARIELGLYTLRVVSFEVTRSWTYADLVTEIRRRADMVVREKRIPVDTATEQPIQFDEEVSGLPGYAAEVGRYELATVTMPGSGAPYGMASQHEDNRVFDALKVRDLLCERGFAGSIGLALYTLLDLEEREQRLGMMLSYPDDADTWLDGKGRKHAVAHLRSHKSDYVVHRFGFTPYSAIHTASGVRQYAFRKIDG